MKNYPIYILLIAILFSSCEDAFEQVVDIEIEEHESLIALNGSFVKGAPFLYLLVAQSRGILDPADYESLREAEVKLFHENNLLYNFQYDEDNQLFEAENTANLPDGNYRLEVNHADYKPVIVEQVMPQAANIVSVDYEKEGTLSPDGERVDEIKVVLKDPAAAENFYSIQAEIFYTYDGDTLCNSSNVYLDSNDPIMAYSDEGLLFSDGTFNGNEQTLLFYFYNYFGEFENIKKINIILDTLTKDRFLYLKSLSAYRDADGNPFAEPVVVHGNVENGFGAVTLSNRTQFSVEF